jgi:hypothetical protein
LAFCSVRFTYWFVCSEIFIRNDQILLLIALWNFQGCITVYLSRYLEPVIRSTAAFALVFVLHQRRNEIYFITIEQQCQHLFSKFLFRLLLHCLSIYIYTNDHGFWQYFI